MRIENVSGSNQTVSGVSSPGRGQPAGLPAGLKQGDSFEAQVVRSEGGTVTLRLPDGQVFEARLEGDAALTPGRTVALTVSDLAEGTVTLTTRSPGDTVSLSGPAMLPPRQAPVGEAAALRPFAEALARQGFPVTAETVAAARDILTQYPELALPKAAFLAGNGLRAGQELLPAAVQVLEGAPLVGAQLTALGTALEGTLPAAEGQPPAEGITLPAGQSAPALEGGTAVPALAAPPSWAALVEGVLGRAPEGPPVAAPLAEGTQPASQAGGLGLPPQEPALPVAAAAAPVARAATAPPAEGLAATDNPVARVLEQLAQPAATAASSQKLEAFGRTLEAAARELEGILALPEAEQSAGLEQFVKQMFTRIDRDARDTPQLLQKARDELFARLTLMDEALRQSGGPQREAVAQQTRQLMDHLRALGRIEQFTYVQLPIEQNGRQQTAELYICRNKERGKKRIDPENVRILLALDLEHMGHVQAFVTIRGKDVSMRLDVGSQAGADYFRSQTVALHGMLVESGYRLLENRVQVQDEPIALERALETLTGYEEKDIGLDVRV